MTRNTESDTVTFPIQRRALGHHVNRALEPLPCVSFKFYGRFGFGFSHATTTLIQRAPKRDW
jgi:hypothetical protein